MPARSTPSSLELRIPWATLVKAGVAVLFGWACVRLWPSFELLLFATLIAIALSPLLRALERRGISRGRSVLGLAIGLLLLLAAFAFFVVPALTQQVTGMWNSLPQLKGRLEHTIERGGLLARVVLPLFDLPHSAEVDRWVAQPMAWGPPAFEVAAALLIVFVLSLYLLLDGQKVVAWILAYAPRVHRRRTSEMVPELFAVVQAYATGQLLTSTLFATFAFGVLAVAGVPGAVPLAVLAAVCDVVPVAGIIVITALATLAALTVSPSAALSVLGLFLAYHVFEAYVLVPRLYGDRMKLSTLTVLLAIVAGGALGGVPGAVLALPLVAAYPVVEKYWLHDWLHPDAVADHSALRDAEDPDGNRKVVNAVLKGRPVTPAK